MKPELLESLLERASKEELGLAITVNNPRALHQNLIDHNRNGKYPNVSICLPTEPETLFIVQKSVELQEEIDL